jgi:hypothetical protein
MQQALLEWLPDLRAGTIEIRDLVNLVVGGLATYLAYLAIRMGREQSRTAFRQAEIAEVQHRIMQEQLAKAVKLRVRCDTAQTHHAPETIIPVEVFNDGNKTARGFFWEVLFSDALAGNVRLVDVEGKSVASIAGIVASDGACYDQYDGHGEEALFPGSSVQIGNIRVNTSSVTQFTMLWRIRFEDGCEPTNGFRKVKLAIDGYKFFNPADAGDEHQRQH